MGVVFFLLLAVVVLVVVGGAVMNILGLVLWWALIGLVIGGLARLVLPGARGIGVLQTILFGIAGSILGGIVANAFDVGGLIQFIIAILVAAVLIVSFGSASRQSGAGA
jgi:uncharacterized membrane protein YeaQ/YmgE (transglycosylase-associated protein family)